jgi:hypothetical protein
MKIGKVSATEKSPTTNDEFIFWVEDNIEIKPFDIIKAENNIADKKSITYAIIQDIFYITDSLGHIGNYVSSDFGDLNSVPSTKRLGVAYAQAVVLHNNRDVYMPLRDGTLVEFASEDEIKEALGDESNPLLTQDQEKEWSKTGLQSKPFSNVKYYYPYKNDEENCFCNTSCEKDALKDQFQESKAYTYVYTYTHDKNNLDLLFSNIDDPNFTMESILNFIVEHSDFDDLDWNGFKSKLVDYTKKGQGKDKEMGFYKGAKYQHPNKFSLLTKRLEDGEENNRLLLKLYHLLKVQPLYIKNDIAKDKYLKLLEHFDLLSGSISRTQILKSRNKLAPYFDKYRNKACGLRYVDFNQGVDPRLITEDKIKLLSEIPISPLRIAFDSVGQEYKRKYIKAIELAAKYGIRNLSNYILYNWDKDTPDDFYDRLRINIDLNDKLGVRIYSFPMKYIPVLATDRNRIGKYWNLKYIRAIQKILLVTGGSVMPNKLFFEKAFGKDRNEFHKIMLMPENYIIDRLKHETNGDTEEWWNTLKSLSKKEYDEAIEKIKAKDFDSMERDLLEHYSTNR